MSTASAGNLLHAPTIGGHLTELRRVRQRQAGLRRANTLLFNAHQIRTRPAQREASDVLAGSAGCQFELDRRSVGLGDVSLYLPWRGRGGSFFDVYMSS